MREGKRVRDRKVRRRGSKRVKEKSFKKELKVERVSV